MLSNIPLTVLGLGRFAAFSFFAGTWRSRWIFLAIFRALVRPWKSMDTSREDHFPDASRKVTRKQSVPYFPVASEMYRMPVLVLPDRFSPRVVLAGPSISSNCRSYSCARFLAPRSFELKNFAYCFPLRVTRTWYPIAPPRSAYEIDNFLLL